MGFYYAHEMGLCAYVEGNQVWELRKWLGWYRRRGVSCFYLYCKAGNNVVRDVVSQEVLNGTVVLIDVNIPKEKDKSLASYHDCIKRVRYICRHLLLAKVGDYLQGIGENSLPGVLGRCFDEDTALLKLDSEDGKGRYLADPLMMSGFNMEGNPVWSERHKLRSVSGVRFVEQRSKCIALLSHVMSRNGAPMALLSVAKILKEAGYEIDVYSIDHGVLEKDFKELGIRVTIDPYIHLTPLADQSWYSYYDLIIANTAVLVCCLSKQLTDTPVLWWLHEGKKNLSICGVNSNFTAKINANRVYAFGVSNIVNEDFIAIAPSFSMSGIMTMGIADVFKEKQRHNRFDYPMKFMLCGTVEKNKGQDILLKAVSLLNDEERRKCRFLLVGGKSCRLDEEEYIEEIISKAAEYPEVRLLKNQPHDEILKLYEEVDAVVVPSREESLSLVAIEAMMMGLPCILSDRVGVASYVHDGESGLVFASEDFYDLAGRIRLLLNEPNKAKKMGRAGRKIYEANFSHTRFAENIIGNVEKIIAEKSS